MSYIDAIYYNDTYKGAPVSDAAALSRMIERASDLIDQATNYVLYGADLTQFAPIIQDNVKKATAAQVEYLALNDESINHGSNFSTVNVGSFSYSEGSKDTRGNRNEQRISPAVIEYLIPTGLLYRGVSTNG